MNFIKKFSLYYQAILACVVFFFVSCISIYLLPQPHKYFEILSIKISLYGLAVALAVITSIYLIELRDSKLSKKINLWQNSLIVIIVAIIFARFWHVMTDFALYKDNLSEILAIYSGGLSIWGAILGGFIVVVIISWWQKINIIPVLNHIALSLPFAQSVGRFGNFFNQELYGKPTNLPWKIFIDPPNRPLEYPQSEYFHPVFLYEGILNVLLFLVLNYLYFRNYDIIRRKLLIGVYLVGYGSIRFIVEFAKINDQILGFNQIVSLCLIILGLGILIFDYKENAKS